METLMPKRADLVRQDMHWVTVALAAKDLLNEMEFTKGLDIANAVDEALAKFKNSSEFTALLKKNHYASFDAGVEAIFYNIWAHYWDLDYTFLGDEMTGLIREWLEEARLNVPEVMPSSIPPSPPTGKVTEIETLLAEAFEQ